VDWPEDSGFVKRLEMGGRTGLFKSVSAGDVGEAGIDVLGLCDGC
jgi:hypothetical protein